jgi:prophage regulatory protein
MLRLPDVLERVGLSKASVYRMVKAGTFPAPAKIGGASRWVDTEIDDYLRAVTSARPTSQPTPSSS